MLMHIAAYTNATEYAVCEMPDSYSICKFQVVIYAYYTNCIISQLLY